MWTIGLRNCRFIAKHGIYEYEQKFLDQEFEVNVEVSLDHSQPIDQIQDTINYEILYEIVEQEMNSPKELLEEVISHIVSRIKEKISNISNIEISIQKLNPLMGKGIGATIVKYTLS
jgi:dihydroneopterin aldolase